MSVIYRPFKGTLKESMKEIKVFDSYEDLQNFIIERSKGSFNIRPCEIIIGGRPTLDERTGWVDSDSIYIDCYDNVEDKEGYLRHFGYKFDTQIGIGIFATEWRKSK